MLNLNIMILMYNVNNNHIVNNIIEDNVYNNITGTNKDKQNININNTIHIM